MAFAANTDNVSKVYTGLANMQVIAINPSKAEAEALGINLKEEPVYVGKTDDGTHKVSIDFWLRHTNPDFTQKVRFFLEARTLVTSTGKQRAINDLGQNTFTNDLTVLPLKSGSNETWFSTKGIRFAFVGECELIGFLRSWLSVGVDQESKLDSPEALFKGDVSELRKYLSQFPNAKVQVLLVEKNGYSNVYTKHFERGGNAGVTRWNKEITNGINSGYPVNIQGSLVLKELAISDSPSGAPAVPANSNPFATTTEEPAVEAPKSDLPF